MDIPTELNSDIHQETDRDAEHWVFPTHTYLKAIVSVDSGMTNSNHHQCIDTLAPVFTTVALANATRILGLPYVLSDSAKISRTCFSSVSLAACRFEGGRSSHS